MKKQAKPETVSYSRDLVFAAACAAQRINGEYVKRTFIPSLPHTGYNYGRARVRFHPTLRAVAPEIDANKTKLYNSALMKSILVSTQHDILPEDYTYAGEVRTYFCSKIVEIFDGMAQEFIKKAIEAAAIDEISTDTPLFGIAASLPSIYERDMKRKKERQALTNFTNASIPLDEPVFSNVKFNITVIDACYKEKFMSTIVNGLVNNISGNRMVYFWTKDTWNNGSTYDISARIKAKGNQTTQLHYVRKVTV